MLRTRSQAAIIGLPNETPFEDVVHELTLVHDLIEAAYMAAETISKDYREPLQTLLDMTSKKQKAACEKLLELLAKVREGQTNG